MKECSQCKITKPIEEFNRKATGRDGYAAHCRLCSKKVFKKLYDADPQRFIKHSKKTTDSLRLRNRAYVESQLEGKVCVDCGNSDRDVLEFDHVRGNKVDCISKMVYAIVPIERLIEEMAKCEVRCCNCHRKITRQRGYNNMERCLSLV